MGCWNETCAISNLPIEAGDKVRWFFLAKNRHVEKDNSGGFCYSTALWAPIGPPLVGVYDDYGSIEDYDTKALAAQSQEKFLRKIVKEAHQYGQKKAYGLTITDMSTLSDFIKAAERGFLKGTIHGEVVPIGCAMVLEEVYQHAIMMPNIGWTRDNEDAPSFRKAADEYLAEVEKLRASGKPFGMPQSELEMKLPRNIFAQTLRVGGDSLNTANLLLIPTIVEIFTGKKKLTKPISRFVYDMADLMALHRSMRTLRKFWSPQSGKGSQDSEYIAMADFCDVVSKLARERQKSYEDS